MEEKAMTLARLSDNWLPGFGNWQSSVPSLIDRFFGGDLADFNSTNFAGVDSTLPAVNVKETNDEFQIDVAAPGLKKEDFKLHYENGKLTISSERKADKKEEKDGKYTRREFYYQSFRRTFTVPETEVNSDAIKAAYAEGILHVTLPKREEVKPKPAKEIKIS